MSSSLVKIPLLYRLVKAIIELLLDKSFLNLLKISFFRVASTLKLETDSAKWVS
jgi:hypothetical protein